MGQFAQHLTGFGGPIRQDTRGRGPLAELPAYPAAKALHRARNRVLEVDAKRQLLMHRAIELRAGRADAERADREAVRLAVEQDQPLPIAEQTATARLDHELTDFGTRISIVGASLAEAVAAWEHELVEAAPSLWPAARHDAVAALDRFDDAVAEIEAVAREAGELYAVAVMLTRAGEPDGPYEPVAPQPPPPLQVVAPAVARWTLPMRKFLDQHPELIPVTPAGAA